MNLGVEENLVSAGAAARTTPVEYADPHKRRFQDLRLSLTDRCSLACLYCVSEAEASASLSRGAAFESGSRFRSPEQYAELIARIHALTDLSSVRLTGGEPTLYKPLARLVQLLKGVGIPEVNLTTNGLLLPELARDLAQAGLDRVNVSLDALEEDVFERLARRRGLPRVLRGIEEVRALGLRVKLNCTVYRGVNEDQIAPLFEFARERGLRIRYLELMRMGHLHTGHRPFFVSRDQITARILEAVPGRELVALPRAAASTAEYFQVREGAAVVGEFGVIANESAPFCRDCNRLRVDSAGRVYGCISDARGIPAMDADSEQLRVVLREAMGRKRLERFSGSEMSMKSIGG